MTSRFRWLFIELNRMFLVAQKLQPDRFDARVVVLWDEYDSVCSELLLKQADFNEESATYTKSASELNAKALNQHITVLRDLGQLMKDMQLKTRMFFVTGITRIALTVSSPIR
jgi:hypothetical protein